jgi:hypothetical protein
MELEDGRYIFTWRIDLESSGDIGAIYSRRYVRVSMVPSGSLQIGLHVLYKPLNRSRMFPYVTVFRDLCIARSHSIQAREVEEILWKRKVSTHEVIKVEQRSVCEIHSWLLLLVLNPLARQWIFIKVSIWQS